MAKKLAIRVAQDRIESILLPVHQMSFTRDGCTVIYNIIRHLMAENPDWVCAEGDESSASQRRAGATKFGGRGGGVGLTLDQRKPGVLRERPRPQQRQGRRRQEEARLRDARVRPPGPLFGFAFSHEGASRGEFRGALRAREK